MWYNVGNKMKGVLMGKNSEYAIEKMKANPKLVKVYIAMVVFFVVLIVAAVSSNSSIQQKLDEAMLKCQANELMDMSLDTEEPSTNYAQAKKDCENFLKTIYNGDKNKFIEEAIKTYDDRSDEVAGHKIDWYLEQVKNNQ